MKTANCCQCGNFLFGHLSFRKTYICAFYIKKSYSLKKQMVRGKEEEGAIECLEAQIYDLWELDSTWKSQFHWADKMEP